VAFTVLIVDDEREACLSLSEILSTHGIQSVTATDPRTVPDLLASRPVDLAIMDMRMPGLSGIDLLKVLKERDRSLPVIVVTGYPSVENAVECMRYGALNFFVKPLKIRELLREVRTVREARTVSHPEPDPPPVVTREPSMLRVLEEIRRVAPTDAPVLITGESGTGKELVANALHTWGWRALKPFVKVNCASIPDTLLESEMFGHEKGAFTDAASRHVGKLELAGEGSLFFDEIGDMSPRTQPKLLRVLQDGEFQRLGGTQTIRSRARIIAATNRDVEALLREGAFREDLYYRLSVVTIDLPPLRERAGDIDLLLEHFVRRSGRRYDKTVQGISPSVRDILHRHPWPGNIRELQNCIERAVIFCDGPLIREEHLPAQYLKIREQGFPFGDPESLEAASARLHRQQIAEALRRTGGEKQEAARLLRISRKTLYNRMKKLGMG
jgi:DNA-binding NtrC family response regulator